MVAFYICIYRNLKKNESDIISNVIIVYKHISEYRYLFKKISKQQWIASFATIKVSKAGPQHLISNYRPIAILPVIEKSLERCVFQNLHTYEILKSKQHYYV